MRGGTWREIARAHFEPMARERGAGKTGGCRSSGVWASAGMHVRLQCDLCRVHVAFRWPGHLPLPFWFTTQLKGQWDRETAVMSNDASSIATNLQNRRGAGAIGLLGATMLAARRRRSSARA